MERLAAKWKQTMAMKSNNKTEGRGTREGASSLVGYISNIPKRLFFYKSHKSSNILFLLCFSNLCRLWFIWSDSVGATLCSHVTKANTYFIEKNQFYIECILILKKVLKKCTGANSIDKALYTYMSLCYCMKVYRYFNFKLSHPIEQF